jgi:hypothetical protein
MFSFCKSGKAFIFSCLVIAVILLSGCNQISSVNSSNVELKTTPKETVSIAENIGILDVTIFPNEKNQKQFEIQVDSVSGSLAAKEGTEFDVMNEYGFLAKGKLISKDNDGFWKAEVIAESIRPNLFELCQNRMLEREKESPNIPAFGVFPTDSARSKINSGNKIDVSEKAVNYRVSVYKSLPKEIQDFGNAVTKGTKGNLDSLDAWSDFNGDGEIDFVVIKNNSAKDEIGRRKYLIKNNNWLEIKRQN